MPIIINRRREPSDGMEKEKIIIGKIVNAVGLKGEVRIYSYSDRKERFGELESFILSGKGTDVRCKVEKVRYQKNMVIAKLAGIDDRGGAESLRDKYVAITEDELAELPEDTFYIKDLIGCRLINEETGGEIGVISDVIQNTAQDIYAADLPGGGTAMIPAVGEFIRRVDIKARTVTIRVIPGLLPDTGSEEKP